MTTVYKCFNCERYFKVRPIVRKQKKISCIYCGSRIVEHQPGLNIECGKVV